MKLVIDPKADKELFDIGAFYGLDNLSAGELFYDRVEEIMNKIAAFPKSGNLKYLPFRTLQLRSFPIDVVYLIRGELIRIVAFAHHSRKPGYWKKRV